MTPSPNRSPDPAPDASELRRRLNVVHQRIEAACRACGRDPKDVELLAVSKTFDAQTIAACAQAGQVSFGENYVQEAVEKIAALAHQPWQTLPSPAAASEPQADASPLRAPVKPALVWHLIGPLQSNKTREVAEHFDWVQSIDRAKIARRLNDQRPAAFAPLNVLIQINVDDEASKSGVAPDDFESLAEEIMSLPRLRLRGMMTIPRPFEPSLGESPDRLRESFRKVREIYERHRSSLGLTVLSMGMSQDLEWAIAEGSTMVRVGTALFGSRPAKTR